MITPSHLNPKSIVNLGSFYTPEFLVEKAHALLQKYISSQKYTLLDSSCGAGNFLLANGFDKIIGADIDKGALDIARSRIDSRITLLHKNALYGDTFIHKGSHIFMVLMELVAVKEGIMQQ